VVNAAGESERIFQFSRPNRDCLINQKLKRNEVYNRNGNSESFPIRVVTPPEALDG